MFGYVITCVVCLALESSAYTYGRAYHRSKDNAERKYRSLGAKDPWLINRGLCPPSLCPATDAKTARRVDYNPFFQGDIVLDAESSKLMSLRGRYKRAMVKLKSRVWHNGVVPYEFLSEINPVAKRAINQAMKHISKHTCIRFRLKVPKDKHNIFFIDEPGCWSFIGRYGDEQKVSIGPGCETMGTAVHEITHALGFWHEQSRPDRSSYIRILADNIDPRDMYDFQKTNASVVSSKGYPYDYNSITHYTADSYSKNGKDTIRVIGIGQRLGLKIGQRKGLSSLDIAQLRHLYKCNIKTDAARSVCPNGWRKFRRSCYKFFVHPRFQFAAATGHCRQQGASLVQINTQREDKFLKNYLEKHNKYTHTWRIGGKRSNGKFVWSTNRKKHKLKPMRYTNWKGGHPPSYSSLALSRNLTTHKFVWDGVWLGSLSQLPLYAYSFICEKSARRPCIRMKYTDGRGYTGTLDHTTSGVNCQKWTDRYPHQHRLQATARNRDGLGDHNYCRNPSALRRKRPWCFTTLKKLEWQYCDIVQCK